MRRFSLDGVLSRLLREGVLFNAFEPFLTVDMVSVRLYIVRSKSSSGDLAKISTPSSDSTQYVSSSSIEGFDFLILLVSKKADLALRTVPLLEGGAGVPAPAEE